MFLFVMYLCMLCMCVMLCYAKVVYDMYVVLCYVRSCSVCMYDCAYVCMMVLLCMYA